MPDIQCTVEHLDLFFFHFFSGTHVFHNALCNLLMNVHVLLMLVLTFTFLFLFTGMKPALKRSKKAEYGSDYKR